MPGLFQTAGSSPASRICFYDLHDVIRAAVADRENRINGKDYKYSCIDAKVLKGLVTACSFFPINIKVLLIKVRIYPCVELPGNPGNPWKLDPSFAGLFCSAPPELPKAEAFPFLQPVSCSQAPCINVLAEPAQGQGKSLTLC